MDLSIYLPTYILLFRRITSCRPVRGCLLSNLPMVHDIPSLPIYLLAYLPRYLPTWLAIYYLSTSLLLDQAYLSFFLHAPEFSEWKKGVKGEEERGEGILSLKQTTNYTSYGGKAGLSNYLFNRQATYLPA